MISGAESLIGFVTAGCAIAYFNFFSAAFIIRGMIGAVCNLAFYTAVNILVFHVVSSFHS